MSSYDVSATAVKPAATSVVIPVRRRLSTRWISLLTLFALLVIWWAVTATGLIEPLFLPPPSAVLQKAGCWQPRGTWIRRCGSTWARASAESAWAWVLRF